METSCAQSTTLTAPPSVWALLAFALTTVLCLAFDSSFGFDRSPLLIVAFLISAVCRGHKALGVFSARDI